MSPAILSHIHLLVIGGDLRSVVIIKPWYNSKHHAILKKLKSEFWQLKLGEKEKPEENKVSGY